jgi:hypothetical protein
LLVPVALVRGLAVALTVVLLNRPASAQTVMLQPAASTGPDPFTAAAHTGPSPTRTATQSAAPVPTGATSGASGVHTVSGTSIGLYGGTKHLSSCDIAQMSAFLRANPDKGRAWAGVEGIRQDQIDAFLRSLTPVLLRTDTRVTNHGFANGAATSFQSVLQAGTAVLVDADGAPRARCACGNPLQAPVVTTRSSFTGTSWSSFDARNITVVLPSTTSVQVIVLFDEDTGQWFERPTGSTGGGDVTVPAPVTPSVGPSGTAGTTSGPAGGASTPSTTCLPSASAGSPGSASSPAGSTSGSASASGSGSGSASSGPSSAQACPSGTSGSPTSPGTSAQSSSGSPSSSPSAPSSPASPSTSASTGSSTGSGAGSSGAGTTSGGAGHS